MSKISRDEIHFVIVNDSSDYKKRVDDGYFVPGMFASAKCVENANDLDEYLKKERIGTDFILIYVHAFRLIDDWAIRLETKIESIKRIIGNTVNVKIVTSDQPDIVKQKFQGADVDRYNDIMRKANEQNYYPQTVDEAYGHTTPGHASVADPLATPPFIFVSHSSADKDVVTIFVEKLLRLGLNITKENIFYTSNYSTGLKAGDHIPDSLKVALSKMTLFIQFISDNYRQSEVCLNEMGVAWYLLPKNAIITLLLPGVGFSQIGFLNAQSIGIKLDDKDNMFKLFDDFADNFKIHHPKAGDFKTKLEEFQAALALLP